RRPDMLATPRMISWPVALLTTLVTVLLTVSSVTSTVVFCACIALALIGPAPAQLALTIATLVNYGNLAIFKVGADGVLIRVVLVAAVLRILPLLRASDFRLLWPVWVFGIVSAVTSAAVSPAVAVSVVKALTFTLAATAVVIAYQRIPPAQLAKLQTW